MYASNKQCGFYRAAWAILAGAALLYLPRPARAADWAEGTVWPARRPITLTSEFDRDAVVGWVNEEEAGGKWEITAEDALRFLASAGHAMGTEVGDVEEALAGRRTVTEEGERAAVTVVARNAMAVTKQQASLAETELLRRAVRVSCSIDESVGEGALAVLRDGSGLVRRLRGEWGTGAQVLEAIARLAAGDPGVLLPPAPAIAAWADGPGAGESPAQLLTTRARGVYRDASSEAYAAWRPEAGEWERVLLFAGLAEEDGQPLSAATAVVRLAAGSATTETRGRIDAVCTGPDGSFLLAIPGSRADQILAVAPDPEFQIGTRKWGYTWAGEQTRPGRAPLVDVGPISLSQDEEPQTRVPEPPDLMLDVPDGYRVLDSSTTDDGGYQRLLQLHTGRLPGSRRLITDSTEVSYVFERNDQDVDLEAWLTATLNPKAAEWMRRNAATREITSEAVERSASAGHTVVQESGEWRFEDGTTVYHTSETHIVALVTDAYHARLQVTAIGSSSAADNRDPAGVVADSRQVAAGLRQSIEGRLAATRPEERTTGMADWLAVDRMSRIFQNIIGLENASVLLEDGEFHTTQRSMPIARQIVRIEDTEATFALGKGVQIVATPGSRVRMTHNGRLRLVTGTFSMRTPVPSAEDDERLQRLGWLIHQAQQAEEDYARSVERAVRLGHISAAYGDELTVLSRESALRSLFATCRNLVGDETLIITSPVPLLCVGESQLSLEPNGVATLNCRSGWAFLGEEAFNGLVRLRAGETSTTRTGETLTEAAAG